MKLPHVFVGTRAVWLIAGLATAWQVFLWVAGDPFPLASAVTLGALLLLAWLRLHAVRENDEMEAVLTADRRRLIDRLLQAEEEERSRIAGDLHDDTIQCMAAALLMLDTCKFVIGQMDALMEAQVAAGLIQPDSPLLTLFGKQHEYLEKTDKLLRGALERTRNLTFEMAPAVLNHSGLRAGVEALVEATQKDMPGVKFDVQVTDSRFEQPQEAMAFRLIREATMNVRKHAHPQSVQITAEERRDTLVLKVTDDGEGFNVSKALEAPKERSYNHMGLVSMIERTRLAGGDAQVTSTRGCTQVRLVIPVQQRKPW